MVGEAAARVAAERRPARSALARTGVCGPRALSARSGYRARRADPYATLAPQLPQKRWPATSGAPHFMQARPAGAFARAERRHCQTINAAPSTPSSTKPASGNAQSGSPPAPPAAAGATGGRRRRRLRRSRGPRGIQDLGRRTRVRLGVAHRDRQRLACRRARPGPPSGSAGRPGPWTDDRGSARRRCRSPSPAPAPRP